jgi:hypothetical protein
LPCSTLACSLVGMAILRVPFSLSQPVTPAERRKWVSDFIEHLGEYALVDMTLTVQGGGTPALTWLGGDADVTHFVAHVVIDDPAATGVALGLDGSPPSLEAAAERVVARAMLEQGLTMENSHIHTDQLDVAGSNEAGSQAGVDLDPE